MKDILDIIASMLCIFASDVTLTHIASQRKKPTANIAKAPKKINPMPTLDTHVLLSSKNSNNENAIQTNPSKVKPANCIIVLNGEFTAPISLINCFIGE
jgi:hypothetical protein